MGNEGDDRQSRPAGGGLAELYHSTTGQGRVVFS